MSLDPLIRPRRIGISLMVMLVLLAGAWMVMPRSAQAIKIEQVRWEHTAVTVITVDLSQADFRLFWRDSTQKLYRQFGALRDDLAKQGLSLRFAMNAGMYHANRQPVGLLVQQGQLKNPLNTAQGDGNFFLQPNGVFAVDQAGQALLEPTAQFARRDPSALRWATQSGPMLLIDGEINPIFDPQSSAKRIRNAVGRIDATHVVFVISAQPIRFYDLASLFKERLGCTDALYLDGSISALYSSTDAQPRQREDFGVMLGVVEPNTAP